MQFISKSCLSNVKFVCTPAKVDGPGEREREFEYLPTDQSSYPGHHADMYSVL